MLNSFLTIVDTRSFCGQCRSRSDHTEHAVLSVVYTLNPFITTGLSVYLAAGMYFVFVVIEKVYSDTVVTD